MSVSRQPDFRDFIFLPYCRLLLALTLSDPAMSVPMKSDPWLDRVLLITIPDARVGLQTIHSTKTKHPDAMVSISTTSRNDERSSYIVFGPPAHFLRNTPRRHLPRLQQRLQHPNLLPHALPRGPTFCRPLLHRSLVIKTLPHIILKSFIYPS